MRSFLKKYTSFAFLSLFLFSGCEKDDICVDGDTPHLIIRFYDKDDMETPKAVTALQVAGEGLGPLSTVNGFTTDSIAIPLRAFESSAVFSFTGSFDPDGDDIFEENTDTVTFNYQTEEIFISRACGYVANYTDLNPAVEMVMDLDLWIDSIEINNTTVSNEAAAHITIYH